MNKPNLRVDDAGAKNGQKAASDGYPRGLAIGVSGCCMIAIAHPLGLLGGYHAGYIAFEWYYGDAITEMRKHEPLTQWSWAVKGGIIGAFASVFASAFVWVLLCRLKRTR